MTGDNREMMHEWEPSWALAGLDAFERAILRFDNPHAYAAGLPAPLHARRERMRLDELAKSERHHADDNCGM